MAETSSILANAKDFEEGSYNRVIAAYDGAKAVGESAYSQLAKAISSCGWRRWDVIESWLYGQEDNALEYREKHGESVRDGKGNFIRSKVCANSSYRSNKSVILGAIKAGVEYVSHDGTVVPKSKVEAAIRAAKADTVEPTKSNFEKALTTVETLRKIYAKLDGVDKLTIQLEVESL